MALQKVTITQIYREDKTSAKTGKVYESLRIRTKEHGQDYLSGFGNKTTDAWQAGTEVELDITEKPGTNGKVYKNFSLPKEAGGTGSFSPSVAELKNMLTFKVIPALEALVTDVAWIKQQLIAKNTDAVFEEPNFEPEPEDKF